MAVSSDTIKASRKECWLMFVVTGLYLLFEVAFAAQLLRVVGSTVDLHDIEEIERAGRVISGLALTLVVWSVLILPMLRNLERGISALVIRVLLLGGSALACCFASFVLQEAIIDYVTDSSTAAQRQAATTLTLVSSSMQSDMVTLAGLELGGDLRSAPETMSFVALFPALALTVTELESKTRGTVSTLLEHHARKELGGEAHFFEQIYQPSANEMKKAYKAYRAAADAYQKAERAIPAEQARLYRAYRNGLGRYTPTSLPKSRHERVRRKLRNEGVPVPSDWKLTDKAGFYAAVERALRKAFEPNYNRAMQDLFGRIPPENLNSTSFFEDPDIQLFWRSTINLHHAVDLRPDLPADVAIASIYEPWIAAIVANRIGAYTSDVSAFEPRGQYYQAGVDAIRVAFIPLIAFGFSLLGAFVHSYKTGAFLLAALIGQGTAVQRVVTIALKGAYAVSVLLFLDEISLQENAITTSDLFESLEAQKGQESSEFIAWSIRKVIQVQPIIYPLANYIREGLFQGLTYDFNPDTDTPLFENEKIESLYKSLG